ncbi:hypothetical protein diail_11823 [Diaporthe ilicicola]|nr:hypothetical protein diail_11823 [Diaporthe ilicicola]
MKSFKPLLHHLYLFLFQVAVSKAGTRLLDACDELAIDINDGLLSGKCHVAGHTMLTSVALDQCLGWGSRADYPSLRGDTTGPIPVKDGAFTKQCTSCSIVRKGERNHDMAHLLCKCGPGNLDNSTEYLFDLESLVALTEEGCFECMGAIGGCVRVAPFRTSRDASIESDPGGGLLDWLELEAKSVPCEENIRNPSFAGMLPETYGNTTHHRCRQEHTLCCYQTPAKGTRTNTRFDAFNLIEGRNHVWRMHFFFNMPTLEITGQLSNVIQFCSPFGDIDECEGETQLDDVPGLPDDDTGVNYLEGSEHLVYDDDDANEHDSAPSNSANTVTKTTSKPTETKEKSDWTTPLPDQSRKSSSSAPSMASARVSGHGAASGAWRMGK